MTGILEVAALAIVNRRTAGRGDHSDIPPDEGGQKLRQPSRPVLPKMIFDDNVFAVDEAGRPEAPLNARTYSSSTRTLGPGWTS
jgi:hypothetical protein